MRKYNIINNSLGWFCFLVAAVTYLLTLEPTASFWDCPEFISQGMKLEVGHPPGNPIFILTARFFINFVGNDPTLAAVAVNVMSALLSAGTILLLFWTITHLVRRMMVGRSTEELPLSKLIVVMGSGVCGALLYTWSDTFWFSAVEGEVYAFSSFCTALVVWLVLKWDTRADAPHSDRYLILVAYVIGISIAVHLLNLLTIPALALVIYYRKAKNVNLLRSVGVLLISFVVVALILYGLVPGFIEIAQYFELFFVNTVGLGYNCGVLIYAVILVGVLVWCLTALYRQKSLWQVRVSFILSVILSGIPFIGRSILIPVFITAALVAYMFFARKLYVRFLNIVATSILVIFAGYSSYAVLLIRSGANPPMNQNSPDNVFALGSYLNREQYGETPLFYGPSFASAPEAYVDLRTGQVDKYITDDGKVIYNKVVKQSPDEPDRYLVTDTVREYRFQPVMFFPRMYSTQAGHEEGYLSWIGLNSRDDFETVKVDAYRDVETGEVIPYRAPKPTFAQNLSFFFNYQLNYMYWRYFMWNFAGRQNDLQGQGELSRGNWISGIPFIDNARLGDQSLLPPDLGEDNKGHNVFYMLPLLMGLLGIAVQMVRGKEGIEQFWVVFLLFFMTGIAIVLYLNQPPMQPRERDYAFAGSFYAFSIWIGMGVYALWLIMRACAGRTKRSDSKVMKYTAVAAAVVGVLIPLQVVSQTWDDHDRSGRTAARDFGMNYLSSLDENAIIFTNGDNDTFPLWYAQEVEGYRTDVRVVNLAYLTTDWYANHAKMPANNAAAIDFQSDPIDYAYDRLQLNYVTPDEAVTVPVDVYSSLRDLYRSPMAYDAKHKMRVMRYPYMYIPVDVDKAVKAGVISENERDLADDHIVVDLSQYRGVNLSEVLSLDMISTSVANGWNRPVYFAMTVPDSYYLNMSANLRNTGLAYEVNPIRNVNGVATDKMYDNVMNKFRWGGLDKEDNLYLDETVRRMVTTHRTSMLDLAEALHDEAVVALNPEEGEPTADARKYASERLQMAVDVLKKMDECLPTKHSPYAIQMGLSIARMYVSLGDSLDDRSLIDRGLEIYLEEIRRYVPYIDYLNRLLADKQDEIDSRGRVGRYSMNKDNSASVGMLNLTATDKYTPLYLYYLIDEYRELGGDEKALGKVFTQYDESRLAGLLNDPYYYSEY